MITTELIEIKLNKEEIDVLRVFINSPEPIMGIAKISEGMGNQLTHQEILYYVEELVDKDLVAYVYSPEEEEAAERGGERLPIWREYYLTRKGRTYWIEEKARLMDDIPFDHNDDIPI